MKRLYQPKSVLSSEIIRRHDSRRTPARLNFNFIYHLNQKQKLTQRIYFNYTRSTLPYRVVDYTIICENYLINILIRITIRSSKNLALSLSSLEAPL